MAEAEIGETLTRSPDLSGEIKVTWSEFLRVPICTPRVPLGDGIVKVLAVVWWLID